MRWDASNEEIAREFGCTVRTVQRKLHILECVWLGADLP